MLTVIRRRMLWVFAAVTLAGLIILLTPDAVSPNLGRFRASYGAAIAAGTVLSSTLFVAGLVDLILQKRAAQPTHALKIIPLPRESWWHQATQTDGRRTAQIYVKLSVYNASDRPVMFAKGELVRPRVPSNLVRESFSLPHPSSTFHSSDHPVEPGHKVEAIVTFMVDAPLSEPPADLFVKLSLTDQHGSNYRIGVRTGNR